MITTKITLQDCQEIFGNNKLAYDIHQYIKRDDLDTVFDILEENTDIKKWVWYIPLEGELRTALSFDIFAFSKEMPTINHLRAPFFPLPCIFYYHGFLKGTTRELQDLLTITDKWRIMEYEEFEKEFLSDSVDDDDSIDVESFEEHTKYTE
jgi:hypothetical protein